MKALNTVVATAATLMVATSVFAGDLAQTQSYAHPTMFGSSVLSQQGEGYYLVGDKKLKAGNLLSVTEKENVVIESTAQDILAVLKANAKGVFNANTPVLRSEMAVALVEGLGIPYSTPKYQYKDMKKSHWAYKWIQEALGANVMIGYKEDRTFRPDQKITKAEVFAVLAQLMDAPINEGAIPQFKGYEMQEIPNWATNPTKEVINSGILDAVPHADKVAAEKYLTTEQVAYLVSALSMNKYYNAKYIATGTEFATVKVKLSERVDARHANIGDTFYAVTTEDTTVSGTTFAAGSKVKGEVVEVSRPGIKNPGYIKIKFDSIKDGSNCVEFPVNVAKASVTDEKTTNFVARLFAAPFSAAGRVGAVAGRSAAAAAMETSNDYERFADNYSNIFANTLSLQPMAGLRSFGKSFVTVGYYVYDIAKLAVSGTFGVLYEFGDEVRYLILPSSTQDSALNPGDEMTVVFNK